MTAIQDRRDIGTDDQPAQPIQVRTLWDAHGTGPVADATTVTHGEAA